MSKYELFDIDDFIADEYFVDWVLNPQPEHIIFWQNWQAKFPQHVQKLNAAKTIVSEIKIHPHTDRLTAQETAQIVAAVQQRITIAPSSFSKWSNRKTWAAIAAVFAITVSAFWFSLDHKKNNTPAIGIALAIAKNIEYQNNTKQNRIIRFSDGSLAIVKPKSKLKYAVNFNGPNRVVYLEGEAFFEVKKNTKQPFLVYAQDMVTQVVGTSFTVSAFGKSTDFKVVVNTGKVKVFRKTAHINSKNDAVSLIPHQQAIYNRSKTILKKDTVTTQLLLAKEMAAQTFTLNKVSLAEVIVKLQNAYGIQINYNNEQLGKLSLTAQLANLPLDQKVELICKAINAECKFSNGEIFIYK